MALTTLGPVTRYVDDLETILRVIAGSDGVDPFAYDLPIGDSRAIGVARLRAARFDAPALSHRQFADFFRRWHDFKSRMTRFVADFDVIVCPAAAIPAPAHETEMKSLEATMLPCTAPFSITGWPVAVVRVGTSEEGLPIGLQIAGKPFQEHVVLAVARLVEQEFGGFVPPRIYQAAPLRDKVSGDYVLTLQGTRDGEVEDLSQTLIRVERR
jgi:amidase